MQLNHDDIDHTTLYRGGGYIVDCWITTKTCATRFPHPYSYYHHHLTPPSKHQKMINILIPTTWTILPTPSHHYYQVYCCIKPLCMLLCPRVYPYTTISTTKVVITFILSTQFWSFLVGCDATVVLYRLMVVTASKYNPLSINPTRYSVVLWIYVPRRPF